MDDDHDLLLSPQSWQQNHGLQVCRELPNSPRAPHPPYAACKKTILQLTLNKGRETV